MSFDHMPLPTDAYERMIEQARAHGAEGPFEDGATHEVGDLQGLLHATWAMLNERQRKNVFYGFIEVDDSNAAELTPGG